MSWEFSFRCFECRDTGTVLARKVGAEGQAPYAFLCSCEAAERKPRAYPKWSSVSGSSDWELVR